MNHTTNSSLTNTAPEPSAGKEPPAATATRLADRRPLTYGIVGSAIGLALGLAIGFVVVPAIAAATSQLIGMASPSPLAKAVEACGATDNRWITVGDNGNSLAMDTYGDESDGASVTDVLCVLEELDVTDSVINRIERTRALDGRLDGTWGDYQASWAYHPDDGLNILIDLVRD